MSLLWVFAFLVGQRLFELWLSRRNYRLAVSRGGREFYPESFPAMVALHAGFLTALFAESFPWQLALDRRSIACLAVLILLQGGRYWCIASLGAQWNTRIVIVPGGSARKSGPYRLLRHPNYCIVTLEFIFIPLLMQTLLTLAVFSILNLMVLRKRIRLEEAALRSYTDYAAQFPAAAGMP